MVKIKEAIVVEGRYDKNTLAQIVDAPIFETGGFGIRKDKALMALLRRVAETRGLIVFTDADGAGLVIRNFIKASIPNQYLKHAYISEIAGKERRKSAPGKEGILGVEGMSPDVIVESLRKAGASFEENSTPRCGGITKQDMMALGLSGGVNSSTKRQMLLERLGFPQNMSANALLQAVNIFMDLEQLAVLVEELEHT